MSYELQGETGGCLQVNSQLLEAVQQKVAISQQLEDWETDLHLVIGSRQTISIHLLVVFIGKV
jgi:hypothetical protein